VLQKNKDAPTIDDVFHEQAILPPINKNNFSGEFDWGENWASMDAFEHAVTNLNFKTVQEMVSHDLKYVEYEFMFYEKDKRNQKKLTELFKEVARAQHKYSKRIGEIGMDQTTISLVHESVMIPPKQTLTCGTIKNFTKSWKPSRMPNIQSMRLLSTCFRFYDLANAAVLRAMYCGPKIGGHLL
jgi:hypothetical protein